MEHLLRITRNQSDKIPHSNQKSNQNIEGFDFLRAIFSVAIVALKTNFFLVIEILVSSSFAYSLTANVAYLAVPVFLQISLFLFYLKCGNASILNILRKRLPRLLSLYLFWVVTIVLLKIFINGEFGLIKYAMSSPESLIEFVISGGQTPFFFFFSLIYLTILAAIVIKLLSKIEKSSIKRLISYFLLFGSCLLIFSLSVTELAVIKVGGNSETGIVNTISNIVAWDYNPICFLPYLFTALITIQNFNEGKLRHWTSYIKINLCILLSLCTFFVILEFHILENLLNYSRLSLVFGSWILLYLALLSPLKAYPAIKFLSSCSLGIYGFHVFFTKIILSNNWINNLFRGNLGLEVTIEFALVLAGSIALTVIAKRMRSLQQFV